METIIVTILGPALTFLSGLVANLIRKAIGANDTLMVGIVVPVIAGIIMLLEKWLGGVQSYPWYVLLILNLVATWLHQVYNNLKPS